jgi:DegV family protein with EDD domain
MLRIVIDSAGDLPADWLEQYDIHVIPINIHFGNRTFLQGIDLNNADFYRLADETGVVPQTSQPSPQQFKDFYRKIAQPGDTILSMHVTSKLSGTFSSCEAAAQELSNEFHIIPFDSACGSAGMGFMAREARLLERLGASLDIIQDRLRQIRSRMQIVLTLNTLEYARRSGRVKALQAALASLLNVKPVISLRDGILELGERIRTRRKALEFVLEEVVRRQGGQLINAAVVHAQDPDVGHQLMEMVRKRLNINELILTELSIGVAANLGPGTVGIVAYPVEQG